MTNLNIPYCGECVFFKGEDANGDGGCDVDGVGERLQGGNDNKLVLK